MLLFSGGDSLEELVIHPVDRQNGWRRERKREERVLDVRKVISSKTERVVDTDQVLSTQ